LPLVCNDPLDALKAALVAKARDGAQGGMQARVIAEGEDWRALDILCTAGPDDRAYEETHELASVSVVLAGTFHYRGEYGAALMTPGAMLLGGEGRCFTCGHEHGEGDRCLSFHFGPALIERIAADTGARRGLRRRDCRRPVARRRLQRAPPRRCAILPERKRPRSLSPASRSTPRARGGSRM
jgi:AraC family transcriptional regulator